jgi:hypothetical protein
VKYSTPFPDLQFKFNRCARANISLVNQAHES